MPRRWKQQTAMFVFLLIAMTRTIFAMKKHRKPIESGEVPYYVISSSESEGKIEVPQPKQKNTPSTKSSEDSLDEPTGFKMKPLNSGVYSHNYDDDLDLNEDDLYDKDVGVEKAQTVHKDIERDNRRLGNEEENEDAKSMHSQTDDQSDDDNVAFFSDQEIEDRIQEAPVFQHYDKGYAKSAYGEGKPLVNRAEWEKDADYGNHHKPKKERLRRSERKNQETVRGKIKDGFQNHKKTQKSKTFRQQPLNGRKTAAERDADFDVNGVEASDSSGESDFEDSNRNHQLKWERSRRSGRMPVQSTPVKVKKVKNENLFALFLEGEDLVKYTLANARHNNFIERIPVTLSDRNGYVTWNVNAETVVQLQLGNEIRNFQTERLKFVNDIFSRIPDTESHTDYDFYFDTTGDYKNWFMLAVHKRKSEFIGRQWKYVATNNFQTSNFTPCDVRNRWIKKSHESHDGICKSLLANGFHFPPDRKNRNQKICENDIQCALTEKLDKCVKFLLLSYSDAKETGFNFRFDDLCLTKDPESLESRNFVVNDKKKYRYSLTDEDIKKAFRNNLCESFKFMMKSKNWPEGLWRYAMESENAQSKEMIKLLFERIKDSPKEKHLDILLKANDKVMQLAVRESTSKLLNDSLKTFRKYVQTQEYQRLLFFGVVKQDLSLCKFAVKNGASLKEKTSSSNTYPIANKYCWCKKRERSQEEIENNPNDMHCLHLKLDDKTALEIATMLARDGLEGGSNKNSFKLIKNYLEDEKNKDKSNMKDLTISIETESEHDESHLETDTEDDSKKRKRKDKK